MLQDTTESMVAFYLARIKRNGVVFIIRFSARQGQQLVIKPLMRPALKIIGGVLGNNIVEVRLTEYDKMIEGFLFCRLYPSLDIGIQIGSVRPYGLYLYALIFENLVELFRIGAVVITCNNLTCKSLFGDVVQEYPSLMFHPTAVGRKRARCNENAPRSQVYKGQGEHLLWSVKRPNTLTEKVTLPERLRVDMQEFVPSSTSTFRAGVEAVFYEDIFHGLSRNTTDAQLLQLAQNPAVFPARLLGNPNYQFSICC